MDPSVVALLTMLSSGAAPASEEYPHRDTRELVSLVNSAAKMVATRGEDAFPELGVRNSRWQGKDKSVFVLDLQGNVEVYPDPAVEGQNQLNLKDVNGRPIIRGIIGTVTSVPGKPEGWYHYEWASTDELIPRWKSSYAQVVRAPSGKTYVVGATMYNNRMERSFVVHMVDDAVAQIEKKGEAAFPLLRDPTNRFIAKDAYVFVTDAQGVEVVNPAFPNLEGRNLLGLKDTQGKQMVREMLQLVQTRGAGWVDYMWPKPGQSISTQKSTYVRIAKVGNKTYLVGSGVYLSDAPRTAVGVSTPSADELKRLVTEAADLLEHQGERAFPVFRQKGSRWFHDDTYLFVWSMDGIRTFHAAAPESEGQDVSELKDVRGRPIGTMFLETVSSASGEGWVHYQYPEPGSIFPIWKSSFVKRVTFPSGEEHLVGSGIYNLKMDETLIEDLVDRAAELVQERGEEAFGILRDKTGPFVFMDTYVFVNTPDGTEVVNPAQPSVEGKNLMSVRDVTGKPMVREYIHAALTSGSAWVSYYWYKPGDDTPTRKQTYVRKVQHGKDTYIVGAGFYQE